MKALIGVLICVPVGLIIYVISVAAILAFCLWFFDKPHEWQTAIPIITSLFSLGIACGPIEKFSETSEKILTFIIAAFWILFVVIDTKGTIEDFIGFFTGNTSTKDELDMLMFYIDSVLNAKIFAVVSGIMAFGSFNK